MDTLSHHAQEGNSSEKRCATCKNLFPATPEFFSRRKTNKDGLDGRCKQCAKKTLNAWRARPETQEHERAYSKEYNRRPERREQWKAYRNRPENRERRTSYMKSYHSRPDVRDSQKTYNHRPDRIELMRFHQRVARKRPGYRTRISAYYARSDVHARMLAHAHTRRARKRNASGIHTSEQIREQYRRQKGMCYYCQKTVKWGKHHVDHVVPLSRGGSNDISNLVIACASCNLKKNNKLPHEWGEGGRLL